MSTLPTDLLRCTARAFYPTDHILVIEALIIHSTLPRNDLCHLLGMQDKALGKVCGRLREDGLLSVQTRQERRADASSYASGGTGAGLKERYTNKEWYYLNYHRAIDSIKYRMYRLNKYVESLSAPTTEKKDLNCPRCGAQWTKLEAMPNIDYSTGVFLCGRCGRPLDEVEDEERANENESMKRLNSQLSHVLQLMQQIDATTVPENDFQSALARQKPIVRSSVDPGQKTEVVDLPKYNLQSSKGLDIVPEKISVQLQNDEDVKRANAEAQEAARREKEARQNAMPEWIAKSTVSGDLSTVGAKEDRERRAREAAGVVKAEDDGEEKKPAVNGGDEDVLAAYWAEMERANAAEAAQQAAEDEEDEQDDEDEDEFEDIPVATGPSSQSASGAAVTNGASAASTGADTPALESSNATDDERDAKRPRFEPPSGDSAGTNGEGRGNIVAAEAMAEGTPAASDADEDDNELEFENV